MRSNGEIGAIAREQGESVLDRLAGDPEVLHAPPGLVAAGMQQVLRH